MIKYSVVKALKAAFVVVVVVYFHVCQQWRKQQDLTLTVQVSVQGQ